MRYSPKNVGRALQARRVSLGLTKAELAVSLGLSPETIANWERGKAPLAACRIFSWLFDDSRGDKVNSQELWRERTFLAEAALRDIDTALTGYRGHSTTNGAYEEAHRPAA